MSGTFNITHGDAIDDSRFIFICAAMFISLVFLLIFYVKVKRLYCQKGSVVSRGKLILPWYMVAINGALLISTINTLNHFAEHNIILSWSSELLNRVVLLRPDVIIFFLAPANIILSVLIFIRLSRRKILLDLINLLRQQRG